MERAPSKMGWLNFSKTVSIILSSCSRFRRDWQVVDTVAPESVMLLQMVEAGFEQEDSAIMGKRSRFKQRVSGDQLFRRGVHAVLLGDLLADEGQLGLDLIEVLASRSYGSRNHKSRGGLSRIQVQHITNPLSK
jgi:hypothetical protein